MQVQVLSTPGCAECASAKRLLDRLKSDYPDLEVEEIDLADQPEMGVRYGILLAPGIVWDGELVVAGVVSESDLRRELNTRAGARS